MDELLGFVPLYDHTQTYSMRYSGSKE